MCLVGTANGKCIRSAVQSVLQSPVCHSTNLLCFSHSTSRTGATVSCGDRYRRNCNLKAKCTMIIPISLPPVPVYEIKQLYNTHE